MTPAPTDIDRSAPVIADHAIAAPRELVWKIHTDVGAWPSWQSDIATAALDAPLAQGATFRWSTFGMDITSTVYAIDDGARILWGGGAAGDIMGIHEWVFTDDGAGVIVGTHESFNGASVAADVDNMQALLDGSLVSWLDQLKATAEAR